MGRKCKELVRSVTYCCYLSSLLVLLLCLEQSLATYNPAQHPQGGPAYRHQAHQYHHDHSHYEQAVNWDGGPPRGGSTMVASHYAPPEVVEEPEPFHPPKVQLKHMSMALRLTSEWNRRLLEGVNSFKKYLGKGSSQKPQQQPQPLSYGSHPVNVHPSRAWHPPIQDGPMIPYNDLTLFHAKAPRDSPKNKQRRGVARWGPELEPFLEHVVEMLESKDGVEIPLAMIYMDRACSVETDRSNCVPRCPFCTPRTVHRLSLVALLLAKQAVEGTDNLEEYYEKVRSLGIPRVQLEQMVEWMKGALGDQGLFVTLQEMKDWGQSWDATFFPKQHQQRLQQQHHHHHHYHAPHQIESF
jgi:hypothetical protein